jgi:hypothetical protein
MKPSIFHVTFISESRVSGEGLAVFKDGAINGGDAGFLYRGSFVVEGINLFGEIRVKKWNRSAVSILGSFSEYDLNLKGSISDDLSRFSVSGAMKQLPERKITINGTRITDAA